MSDPALATTAAHLVQSDQAPPALIPGDQVPGEGQLVDPAGDVETRAAALLTKSTQEILMLLASGMTEENAPQLLMKVQALAQTQRQLLPYFGGYLQPEHDPRRKQRGMAKASRKRHVSAESHAARTIQELMAVAGKLQAEWTLPQTIRAVKAARDAGMEDVAKELEARVRGQVGISSDPPSSTAGFGKPEQDKVAELLTDHIEDRYTGGSGISIASGGYAVASSSYGDSMGSSNLGLSLDLPQLAIGYEGYVDPLDMDADDELCDEEMAMLAEEGMDIGMAMSGSVSSGVVNAINPYYPNPLPMNVTPDGTDYGQSGSLIGQVGSAILSMSGDIVGGDGEVYGSVDELPPYVIGFESDGTTLASEG
jgi:hypothetical protein